MLFSTKEEYRRIFEEFYNPLCNYAFKYVKRDDLAEDIVQEVFVQMWQKRAQIHISSPIKHYLFQSTRNKAIEFIRRNKLEQNYMQEELNRKVGFTEMEEQADTYLLKEQLNRSIRQLPSKCQQIFVMSKMNGLTYSEIAEELGISVKTVENQISRALKILRGILIKMKSDNEN